MDSLFRSVRYLPEDVPCLCGNGLYYHDRESLYDLFNGVSIRNRVIIRFDLLKRLESFFTQETLSEFRMVIFRILAKDFTAEEYSSIFIELAGIDTVFAGVLRVLYDTMPSGYTFGDYIIENLVDPVLSAINMHTEYYKGKSPFVVGDDFGYLYISIADEPGEPPLLDEVYEEVSYAKSWQGFNK